MPSPKARTWNRVRERNRATGPPSFGTGGWTGGPIFQDAYRSRRAPTPFELSEIFKGVGYACAHINAGAVTRARLGLYAMTGRSHLKPKCETRPLNKNCQGMLKGFTRGDKLSKCAQWFQKQADKSAGEIEEVMDHPTLTMLSEVNDDFDYDSLITLAVIQADMLGHFFWLPEANGPSIAGKAVPDLLWPLLSQYVLPIREPTGSVVKEYTYFGSVYAPTDLIRGRFVSLRDPYGMGYGPMQAAYAYAGLSDEYVSLQQNMMTQGGKLSGIITDADARETMSKAESERWETITNAKITRGNQGRIIYIPGSKKFIPLQLPPPDLASLEIEKNVVQRIANCFGVPLSLLKTEDVNLANAEAGHRQHTELAVDPRCIKIASALTKWTRRYGQENGLEGWERLFWAFDDPTVEDRKRNAEIHKVYSERGTLSEGEIRRELGYEPREGDDQKLVPTTMTTLDLLMNPPEPPAPAASGDGNPPKKKPKPKPSEGGKALDDDDDAVVKALGLEAEYRRPFIQGVPRAHEILAACLKRTGHGHKYLDGSLSGRERYVVLHQVRLDGRRWFRAEAEKAFPEFSGTKGLFGDAAKRAKEFFDKGRAYLRELLLAGAMSVLGPEPLTPADMERLARAERFHREHLDRFEEDVLMFGTVDVLPESDAAYTAAEFAAQAELYGGAPWPSSVNLVRAKVVGSTVFGEERRRHIGSDLPCNTCISEESQGWVPTGTLRAIGDSECMNHCHCVYDFRVDASDPDVWMAGRGPLDEWAFGATG